MNHLARVPAQNVEDLANRDDHGAELDLVAGGNVRLLNAFRAPLPDKVRSIGTLKVGEDERLAFDHAQLRMQPAHGIVRDHEVAHSIAADCKNGQRHEVAQS